MQLPFNRFSIPTNFANSNPVIHCTTMLLLLLAAHTFAPKELRILFLGNSHTANFSVPQQVQNLIESSPKPPKVLVDQHTGANLNTLDKDQQSQILIEHGHYDYVVLQGAMVSSSHKYTYSQEGALDLAKLAQRSKAKVFYFSEWPRKGIDETEYTANVYKGIAKAAGGEVINIGAVWDAALKADPTLDLWSADGNHSSQLGAYLASYVIARRINDQEMAWSPDKLDTTLATQLRQIAVKQLTKK